MLKDRIKDMKESESVVMSRYEITRREQQNFDFEISHLKFKHEQEAEMLQIQIDKQQTVLN